MRILLLTGIYPPAIGGPATYVWHLAQSLTHMGHTVEVLTYATNPVDMQEQHNDPWKVHYVSSAMPFVRWWRYARRIRRVGRSADVIYAFSSISCGVPLILSRISGPRCFLRLGGDFFWERWTDIGVSVSLRTFYQQNIGCIAAWCMRFILCRFDGIIYSTAFQKNLYAEVYSGLPQGFVVENARILTQESEVPQRNEPTSPYRLLFLGRFVHFKHVDALIKAVAMLPEVTVDIVGSGPKKKAWERLCKYVQVEDRVRFLPPVSGTEKYKLYASYHVLVLPSLTEISPNTALEAAAAHLPVLLTKENGLSAELLQGMQVADLSTPEAISDALRKIFQEGFPVASGTPTQRTWDEVAREHCSIFSV